ncbi:CobW family GTP-binding protein [Pygmaiobacter massiliensis]|uniref:CobW family GTP-binding protein n=1 Tax=Pygmaiobacter massiliensis TaxID=1917873 RepID=UPI00289F7C21|nr:GTP-binding protein [Pygmaiobacter massiliensis]
MTRIDIFSGFLGAGKTTLIKKLIAEAFTGEKLVLIENEFGEIGIDGGFMKDAGIEVTEMNSGCICCSLVGDFSTALEKVIHEYQPDRILIEPSGVGKLSDVIRAVEQVAEKNEVMLGSFVAVADAGKAKLYEKNFGEFYNDQIEHASAIILSRTQTVPQDKLETALHILRSHNPHATIITTPWEQLPAEKITEVMNQPAAIERELHELLHEAEHCHDHEQEYHHEHGHHDHDENCSCGCHDEHEEHDHHHDECCCHDHDHEHHHDHEEEHHHAHEHDHAHDHAHEHHHEHGEECSCGCHGHHHADDVFASWGVETIRKYTAEQLKAALKALDEGSYGTVLRAKGIVAGQDGNWLYFDHVPGEADVRTGSADVIGRFCVIGAELDEAALKTLFEV